MGNEACKPHLLSDSGHIEGNTAVPASLVIVWVVVPQRVKDIHMSRIAAGLQGGSRG